MSATSPRAKNTAGESDLILWVAGGAVASVGVAWLLISQPWSSGPQRAVAVTQPPAQTLALASPSDLPAGDAAELDGALDNPLRMAELAYEAGMLVEPEEYSAWTLYSNVAKQEPDNAAALEGLTKVADELIRRGETAWEQGRFNDASGAIDRVLAALPGHEGATSLRARMRPDVGFARAPADEPFKPELPVQEPAPIVAAVPVVQPAAPDRAKVDPIAEAHQAFETALNERRLLTPVEQSAKHFIGVLTRADADHELTRGARARLAIELLARAADSLEASDVDAAETWIDEAELLEVDPAGVKAARDALTNRLIAMESAKPLPASALKIATYVAPEYPQRALDRRVEGWVDIEFTVAADGTTRDIRVAGASHDNYFRREAVAAIEQWSFEPRVYMGRPIEQRSYTRIRFVE